MRPLLQEAALNNEFDVLLVFMFDRIGRIDDETPFIVEWFVKKAGIEVWSVKEGEQRFETHVDKLTNYIRFWQASGESEKTSIRVKSRIRQLKLKGVYTGGPLQYGYCLIPSTEVNRKGQPMQKYAVDMEQYVVYRMVVEKTINKCSDDLKKPLSALMNFNQNNRQNINVFSMTEDYDSDAMWGLYANSNRGFCIEYDFRRAKEMPIAMKRKLCCLFQIIYMKEIKEFSFEKLDRYFFSEFQKYTYNLLVCFLFVKIMNQCTLYSIKFEPLSNCH